MVLRSFTEFGDPASDSRVVFGGKVIVSGVVPNDIGPSSVNDTSILRVRVSSRNSESPGTKNTSAIDEKFVKSV